MKNNRTFLEKLLDGAEVEWKPLWSVTTWDKRFNAVEKEKQPKVIKYHYYLASELKPLIVDGGNVKLLTTNESDIWTTEELVQSNISEGEIIAIPWGGNPIVQYYKGKFVTADNRIATSNNTKILDNKFLYYFLLSKLDVISSFYRGSGIKHPSMYHVLEMLIPIPPLSVQIEIVKILDALTALTSELTSELILRQKQYEYYREKLLDRAEVKWIPLGDVADYEQPTKYLVNSTVYNDNYPTPVLTAGKTFILGYTNEDEGIYFASKSPVIIFDDFTTANKWVDFDFKAKSSAMKMITSKNEKFALLKYIYYWLNTLPNNQTDGDHKRQWISNYANKLIPIPPLSVQTEIVKILDKFETLTNSITEGLPLAIEQSQKRYEYYRELLLNFKQ